jgi:hypothetical protein
MTIKHVEDNGHETVVTVNDVSFDPKDGCLIGYGSPGPDEGARVNGMVRYNSGHAFVMNEQGKTVGVYNLRPKK